MKASIADFEKEISSKNIQNDEIISKYNELEKQIELEKSDNEQLSMQLDMYRQKVYDLEKTIAQNILAIEEQRMIGEKVEQELKLEKARGSNYKINMFKEELNNIYQKIETFEDESEQHVRTINELQQQLFAERLRANKADDDLSEFIKLVSGLKDKMFSEQNQLEKQVKMVMEKRNAQQPEMINDCLISWACEEKSVN
jgi:chromosome segregation ATPase